MNERQRLLDTLTEELGKDGCGISTSCEDAEIYRDETGWKMKLEGFMEPWDLGATVEEAQRSIRKYAKMGFGLS
jgi:hypothetical protein